MIWRLLVSTRTRSFRLAASMASISAGLPRRHFAGHSLRTLPLHKKSPPLDGDIRLKRNSHNLTAKQRPPRLTSSP